MNADEPRPHGEHPTLGLCECDECVAWDIAQGEPEVITTIEQWEAAQVRWAKETADHARRMLQQARAMGAES
jgi:hypothetical protein